MSERVSGPCPQCGTWRYSLHRDHIIPKFKGGPDTPDNIQRLCANCHEDKTRLDMKGFNKGKPWTDETRTKMSTARKPWVDERKAKQSARLKGKPSWNKGRLPWNKGKLATAEHRAKLSIAHRSKTKPDTFSIESLPKAIPNTEED